MADPAGEADGGAQRLDFDRRVMLRFHGSAITSDGGLLAYRELATKPAHGQSPDEWWPRSSGIRVSFIRASALSSPTWRGRTDGI
jgi:hypothetical protein